MSGLAVVVGRYSMQQRAHTAALVCAEPSAVATPAEPPVREYSGMRLVPGATTSVQPLAAVGAVPSRNMPALSNSDEAPKGLMVCVASSPVVTSFELTSAATEPRHAIAPTPLVSSAATTMRRAGTVPDMDWPPSLATVVVV